MYYFSFFVGVFLFFSDVKSKEKISLTGFMYTSFIRENTIALFTPNSLKKQDKICEFLYEKTYHIFLKIWSIFFLDIILFYIFTQILWTISECSYLDYSYQILLLHVDALIDLMVL